ncbi:MAG: putative oxidoreductase [Pseudohongiellaceae bacterium]|jgi:putative oxidoreductase
MLEKIDTLLGRLGDNLKDTCWLIFRLLSSAMFMTHGFGKIFGENPQPITGGGMTSVNLADVITFPMPMDINALYVAGIVELFGGALILIGLWTHLVALIALIIMVFAYLTAHLAWFPTLNNGELAAMYILTFFLLFSFGPGQYSIDTWLSVRRQEKRKSSADKPK